MSLFCDNCGHENSDGAKFCKACGQEIISAGSDKVGPGSVLDNRYEIVRLIKAGGMGSVYEALDNRFQKKKCALKEMLNLSQNPGEQEYFIASFKKEAKMLYSLKHMNLPGVKDYFIEKGRYYLVMDYIEGTDLENMMRNYEGARVPENTVIQWAEQILDVLQYLHNQNPPIVYRDLKPANIMLRLSDNKIFLIDFGIARAVNPESNTVKTGIGTPVFAPGEIMAGHPEPASDIYSLGATMHCLLTGMVPSVPFSFKPVRDLNPCVSEKTEKVVMKALSQAIKDRYRSAEEMKNDLIASTLPQVIEERTVPEADEIIPISRTVLSDSIQPVSPTVKADTFSIKKETRPEKKNPVITILIITCLACLFLLAMLLMPLYNKNEKARLLQEGISLMEAGKYDEAVGYFDKALKIDPKDMDILTRKKEALKKEGEKLSGEKKYSLALVYYDKVLDIDEKDRDSLYNKGIALYEEKKYDDSLSCFEKAIELDPQDYLSRYKKGMILYNQEKYEEALPCFDKTIEIEPEYLSAWSAKILILYTQEKYDEARTVCNKILKTSPDFRDGWYSLGKISYSEKKYDEAFNAFDKAVKIDPDFAPAWCSRGDSLYGQGKYKDAIASYDRSLDIQDDYIDALNNKGVSLYNLEKYEEAIECYDKILEIDQENENALINKENASKAMTGGTGEN